MIPEQTIRVELRPVDRSNYEAVCDLQLRPEQKNYVAENTWSLVEAAYNEGYEPRAIYCNEKLVGFMMWVKETPKRISIWRFMVDKDSQNLGIGTQALTLAIEAISASPGLEFIEISYEKHNSVAKAFYQRFGFVDVGLDESGTEMIAEMAIGVPASN